MGRCFRCVCLCLCLGAILSAVPPYFYPLDLSCAIHTSFLRLPSSLAFVVFYLLNDVDFEAGASTLHAARCGCRFRRGARVQPRTSFYTPRHRISIPRPVFPAPPPCCVLPRAPTFDTSDIISLILTPFTRTYIIFLTSSPPLSPPFSIHSLLNQPILLALNNPFSYPSLPPRSHPALSSILVLPPSFSRSFSSLRFIHSYTRTDFRTVHQPLPIPARLMGRLLPRRRRHPLGGPAEPGEGLELGCVGGCAVGAVRAVSLIYFIFIFYPAFAICALLFLGGRRKAGRRCASPRSRTYHFLVS
jgi:hypothetical protein